MTFREALERIPGLRDMTDRLEILSGPGRRALSSSPWCSDTKKIEESLQEVESVINTWSSPTYQKPTTGILLLLAHVREIITTLSHLQSGETLDDVELFEIKSFAMTATELKKQLENTPLKDISSFLLPDLSEVVSLLDPEATGSSNFYVYDSYSPELAAIRRKLKKLTSVDGYDEEEAEALTAKCLILEGVARVEISQNLSPFATRLIEALECCGHIDLTIAKGRLAMDEGFSKAALDSGCQNFHGLWNPTVKRVLEQRGVRFQPVDITFRSGTTLITGANMGGKSLTLKSIALSQALMQFGFYVPAARASLVPVEDILISMGDGESQQNGLSSFGAEIVRINQILETTEKKRCLVLIDEPARTTNPIEGRAIAQAFAEIMNRRESFTLMATHYDVHCPQCRLWRVKGLGENIGDLHSLTPGTIATLMDYSLIEDSFSEKRPREALRIAALLIGQTELVEKASSLLTTTTEN